MEWKNIIIIIMEMSECRAVKNSDSTQQPKK